MLVVIVQCRNSCPPQSPPLPSCFELSSDQDGIYALQKIHYALRKKRSHYALGEATVHSTLSLRSFCNIALETVPMFIHLNPHYDTDLFLDLLVGGGSNALQDDLEGLLQQLPLNGLADQRDGGIPVVAGGRHHQLIVVGGPGEPVRNKGFGLVLLVNRSAGSQLALVNVCFALHTYCLVCFAHLLSRLFSFAHLLSCLFCFAHIVLFVLHTYCLICFALLLSYLFSTLTVLLVSHTNCLVCFVLHTCCLVMLC